MMLPLGSTAPVVGKAGGSGVPTFSGVSSGAAGYLRGTAASPSPPLGLSGIAGTFTLNESLRWNDPGLEVNLSSATAATINSLRQAFQIQKLLERDARGGTRYIELLRSHFGVVSPDARLQRPEFLGGGTIQVIVNPVVQNSSTDATTPQGHLAAFGTAAGHNVGFVKSFVEHVTILGLLMVRADISYQQGMRRMWRRRTRYD